MGWLEGKTGGEVGGGENDGVIAGGRFKSGAAPKG